MSKKTGPSAAPWCGVMSGPGTAQSAGVPPPTSTERAAPGLGLTQKQTLKSISSILRQDMAAMVANCSDMAPSPGGW